MAALASQVSAPKADLAGTVAGAAAGATPYGAMASAAAGIVSSVMADPSKTTNQTAKGDQRSNWAFTSGDFNVNIKSSGTNQTTGNRAVDQGMSEGGLGSVPWWGWLIAAVGVVASIFFLRR